MRKQKEWCEQEYRRHHESMSKSLNHYRQALKERQEIEVVTERNLQEVQRRLSLGWARSQAYKEELRSHAAETLSNFLGVRQQHETIENLAQKEKLEKFLTRRDKQQKYFNKWEKEREKQIEELRNKAESKQGNAKHNQDQAHEEMQRLSEEIEERFREH
jgi:hypothetical protein